MNDLKNTIAHILEHAQHLAEANEATIQQYVVLPILRALEWDDTNLASMEILPEYKVENRRADYALHIKQKQDPAVLIECKRWNQPIEKNEEQICFYAYSGNVPLAIITNGKLWRFYLSRWEASSLSDRIFCETNIEDQENIVSDLEKYLSKSNVETKEAELNAEIALEEKEALNTAKSNSIDSRSDPTGSIIDNNLSKREDSNVPKSTQNDHDKETTARKGQTKMTEDQVREIRERHAGGESLTSLANAFDMSPTGIRNIVKRNTWKHVE